MSIFRFFPPPDILERVEEVESGLRQRKRLGTIGQLSFIIITTLQLFVTPSLCGENFQKCLPTAQNTSENLPGNQSAEEPAAEDAGEQEADQEAKTDAPELTPWLFISIFLLSLSLFLWVWSKVLLQESKGSFRYTYDVDPFTEIQDADADPATKTEDKLAWLQHDLLERLSTRVGRLSWLETNSPLAADSDQPSDSQSSKKEEVSAYKSHIHIGGYYLIRKELREKNQWLIEVTPWVRIGPSHNPKVLSHPVKFRLRPNLSIRQSAANIIQPTPTVDSPSTEVDKNIDKTQSSPEISAAKSAPSDQGQQPAAPPKLSREEYEKLLERVYSSITTLVYEQIRQDVQTKIDLLPTNYYRATAYFYEAEDYANSNTLYAYQKASELYRASMNRYDPPQWKAKPSGQRQRRLQRWGWQLTLRYWHPLIRRNSSRLWPRLGRYEVMSARAEIGYATVLMYQYILASTAGQRSKPNFAARPVISKAINRLEKLSSDVAERNISLFKAYVTQALVWHYSGATHEAKKILERAQNLLPSDAQGDFQYLFVSGLVTEGGRKHWTRSLLRQSTDLKPSFELSQLMLAYIYEMLWRTRPTLEREVAENIFEEYEKVLKLNPGNLAAWANRGYMRWLLGGQQDIEKAEEDFKAGCEYKYVKRDSFVAELDYGLARIAAEQGNFQEAYNYYTQSTSALLAQGHLYRSQDNNYSYHFELIDKKIYERFKKYKNNVETVLQALDKINDRDFLHLQKFDLAALRYAHISGNPDSFSSSQQKQVSIDAVIACLENIPEKILESFSNSGYINGVLAKASQHLKSDFGSYRRLETMVPAVQAFTSGTLLTLEELMIECGDVIKKLSAQIGSKRIRKSVYAFVLNDYGDAAYDYYGRTGDRQAYHEAIKVYRKAINLHENYIFPHYNLGLKLELEDNSEKATEDVRKTIISASEAIRSTAPEWPQGKFARVELFFRRRKILEIEENRVNEEVRKNKQEQEKQNERIKNLEAEPERHQEQKQPESDSDESNTGLETDIKDKQTGIAPQGGLTPSKSKGDNENQIHKNDNNINFASNRESKVSQFSIQIQENSHKKKEYAEAKKELEDLEKRQKDLEEIKESIRFLLDKDAKEFSELEKELQTLIPVDLRREAGLLSDPPGTDQVIRWLISKNNEYSALQEEVQEIHVQAIRYLGKFHHLRRKIKNQSGKQINNYDKKAIALWNHIQEYYFPYDFDLFLDIKELAANHFYQNEGDEQYLDLFYRLFGSQKGISQIIRTWISNDEEHLGVLSWLRYDDELFEKIERLEELSKFLQKRALPKDCDYRDWVISELRAASELEIEFEIMDRLQAILAQDRKDVWLKILERLSRIDLRIYEKLSNNIQQGRVKITDSELEKVLVHYQSLLDIKHLTQRLELHRLELAPQNRETQQQANWKQWLKGFPQESSEKALKSYFAHRTLRLVLTENNFTTIQEWVRDNLQDKLDKLNNDRVWWQNRAQTREVILFASIEREIGKASPGIDILTKLFKDLEEEAHLYRESSKEKFEEASEKILNRLIQIYEEDIYDNHIKEALIRDENRLFIGRVLNLLNLRESELG